MSPEYMASKDLQELKDWLRYYKEECAHLENEIARREANAKTNFD